MFLTVFPACFLPVSVYLMSRSRSFLFLSEQEWHELMHLWIPLISFSFARQSKFVRASSFLIPWFTRSLFSHPLSGDMEREGEDSLPSVRQVKCSPLFCRFVCQSNSSLSVNVWGVTKGLTQLPTQVFFLSHWFLLPFGFALDKSSFVEQDQS